MKISEAFLRRRDDPPAVRESRDGRTGELIQPCVGVRHHWEWIRPQVLKCVHCQQIRMAER